MMTKLPVVFFGHGSPTNALEDNAATQCWQSIGDEIGLPRAIVVVSAHWYCEGTRVTAMPAPKTIHDFGRLSDALFTLSYPAPGSPELAERICQLLDLKDEALDQTWGLDHGTWVVLQKAYPLANVPVVQVSIDCNKTTLEHYQLGQKLSALRSEGVLVTSSGNIVHNLKVMDWDPLSTPYDWAEAFNNSIVQKIQNNEHASIINYEQLENSTLAIPHPDHFLPLLYALGASEPSDTVDIRTHFIQYRSLGMTSLVFK